MSEELDEMYYSIYNNQIPNSWFKFIPSTSKKLSSWFDDLV